MGLYPPWVSGQNMTVHFIGAGPGASDLITLRGYNLLLNCPVVLYAGSLVPVDLLKHVRPDTKLIDTASLSLPQIIEYIEQAHQAGFDVVRLHSGDPSIYGAIAEQISELKKRHIPFNIVPGVSSFAAAAAVLERELTLPAISQTVILTRVEGKASPMPKNESLENLAAARATMILYLSIRRLRYIVRTLIPFYGPKCPVAVCYRISWPDQIIVRGELQDIVEKTKPFSITRTALVIVGTVLTAELLQNSHLYDPEYEHIFRNKTGQD